MPIDWNITMGATTTAANTAAATPAKLTPQQESEALNALLVTAEKDLKATKDEMQILKLQASEALWIDLDTNQKTVVEYFEFEHKFLQGLAESAFASVLRGRVSSALNKCIVERHAAYNKGRTATVAELDTEIKTLEALKSSIS
jgi:hypothetical protein